MDAKSILSNEHFRPDKTTAIFIHGYNDSIQAVAVQSTASAYITNGGFNLVVLDWGPMAIGSYEVSIANVQLIGELMVDVVMGLVAAGLSLRKMHFVGHSVGAQMCGLIGDGVKKKSNNSLVVDRITALDPALPLFYDFLHAFPITVRSINKDDATFIDVIHTDAGMLGVPNSCGDVDFWPNSGIRAAPGCPVVPSLSLLGKDRLFKIDINSRF